MGSAARPRIALTCRLDPAGAGGIEAVVAALVPALSHVRPGWDVRAVQAFERPTRLNAVPFASDLVAAVILGLRTRHFDAVVVNGSEYAWPRAFGRARAHTIVAWHGTRAAEVPSLRAQQTLAVRIYRRLEVWLQATSFAFRRHIAVSPDVVHELLDTYGRDGGAVVIPNGAPRVSTVVRDPVPGRVLWIGTSPFKKGLDLAIEAVRAARRRVSHLTLRIVGLERGTPGIPQEGWIDVAGRVPSAKMVDEYRHADVLLATTRYEGCSMAVLEALAYGVPMVGSPTLRWMLADAAPSVVRATPGEFAAALAQLASDPDAREQCSAAERERARAFDWEAAARAYAEEIEACLALA